jgi:branched-subunit amino acid transport protein
MHRDDGVADGDLWPYAVILVGAVATELWRALGVAMAGRIKPDSPILDLVGYIAYALLAALIARMILLPIGPLQGTSLATRLIATAVAVAVFFGFRRNLLAGVLAGGATLAALAGGISFP